jgi:hypothetical protein
VYCLNWVYTRAISIKKEAKTTDLYLADVVPCVEGVRFVVFNATFNNILVISWRSVLLVEETGGKHIPCVEGVRAMVFNVTFKNISVISWRSVLLVEETGVPGENHRPVASH